MKIAAATVLSGLIVFLCLQIYSFWGRDGEAEKALSGYQTKLDKAKFDQQKFQDELNYYSNQVNLEKELRRRFNYKAPDEKMVIIVPKNESTTSQNP